jgi:rhodanese-related sulfurtransferase
MASRRVVRVSGIDAVLAAARARIGARLGPDGLDQAMSEGALVVDIRPVGLRARDGELAGAVVIDRNQLEWRLDPTCPHRLPDMSDPARRVIIVCDEGYASSLAAASLRDVGLTNVTDLEGGFQACRRPSSSID